jgi:hypothetical protein
MDRSATIYESTSVTNKMPRNTTGGSGHKSRANSEGNVTKKNRELLESYLDDIESDGKCEDVYVAKVTKKLGDGRIEATYMEGERSFTIQAVIKGSLRGRGKSQAFVDIGSLIIISDTGLVGSLAYEVIAVVPPKGTPLRSRFDEIVKDSIPETKENTGGGFEFDHEEDDDKDVEIDNI